MVGVQQMSGWSLRLLHAAAFPCRCKVRNYSKLPFVSRRWFSLYPLRYFKGVRLNCFTRFYVLFSLKISRQSLEGASACHILNWIRNDSFNLDLSPTRDVCSSCLHFKVGLGRAVNRKKSWTPSSHLSRKFPTKITQTYVSSSLFKRPAILRAA